MKYIAYYDREPKICPVCEYEGYNYVVTEEEEDWLNWANCDVCRMYDGRNKVPKITIAVE